MLGEEISNPMVSDVICTMDNPTENESRLADIEKIKSELFAFLEKPGWDLWDLGECERIINGVDPSKLAEWLPEAWDYARQYYQENKYSISKNICVKIFRIWQEQEKQSNAARLLLIFVEKHPDLKDGESSRRDVLDELFTKLLANNADRQAVKDSFLALGAKYHRSKDNEYQQSRESLEIWGGEFLPTLRERVESLLPMMEHIARDYDDLLKFIQTDEVVIRYHFADARDKSRIIRDLYPKLQGELKRWDDIPAPITEARKTYQPVLEIVAAIKELPNLDDPKKKEVDDLYQDIQKAQSLVEEVYKDAYISVSRAEALKKVDDLLKIDQERFGLRKLRHHIEILPDGDGDEQFRNRRNVSPEETPNEAGDKLLEYFDRAIRTGNLKTADTYARRMTASLRKEALEIIESFKYIEGQTPAKILPQSIRYGPFRKHWWAILSMQAVLLHRSLDTESKTLLQEYRHGKYLRVQIPVGTSNVHELNWLQTLGILCGFSVLGAVIGGGFLFSLFGLIGGPLAIVGLLPGIAIGVVIGFACGILAVIFAGPQK